MDTDLFSSASGSDVEGDDLVDGFSTADVLEVGGLLSGFLSDSQFALTVETDGDDVIGLPVVDEVEVGGESDEGVRREVGVGSLGDDSGELEGSTKELGVTALGGGLVNGGLDEPAVDGAAVEDEVVEVCCGPDGSLASFVEGLDSEVTESPGEAGVGVVVGEGDLDIGGVAGNPDSEVKLVVSLRADLGCLLLVDGDGGNLHIVDSDKNTVVCVPSIEEEHGGGDEDLGVIGDVPEGSGQGGAVRELGS